MPAAVLLVSFPREQVTDRSSLDFDQRQANPGRLCTHQDIMRKPVRQVEARGVTKSERPDYRCCGAGQLGCGADPIPQGLNEGRCRDAA
jgi:hypothetical protein